MIWVSRNFILAGLMTLAVLIFGLGGWMIRTEIKGAVVASGRIEVEKKPPDHPTPRWRHCRHN